MDYEVKQSSTTDAVIFLMIDSDDHISGKTGLTPTVTLSKAGSAFAAKAGTVSEISSGWYKLVDSSGTDTNTQGPLIIHAEAPGADDYDGVVMVVAYTRAELMARLTSGNEGSVITVVNPVADGGVLNLYAGDDYLEAINTQLEWSAITDWTGPTLSTLDVVLRFMRSDEYAVSGLDTPADLEVDAEVTDVSGDAVFTAELTSEESAQLTSYGNKQYVYQVIWTDASLRTRVQIQGFATILRRAAPSADVVEQTIFRPNGNYNTQWTTYDYVNLDDEALQPALPSEFATGIVAHGPGGIDDSGETQSYTIASPDRTITLIRVWIWRFSTSYSGNAQVSITVGGSTAAAQTLTSNGSWEAIDFTGSWTASDFTTAFRVNLIAPTIGNLGTFAVYGLYCEVE